MSTGWNHNTYYHRLILKTVPPNCYKALDVGCGEGQLVQKLSTCCSYVTGIDTDETALTTAGYLKEVNVTFINGDVMSHPFPYKDADLITCVATLHHLKLEEALFRFRALLKPGGVLVIIGLYKMQTFKDYLYAVAAIPVSRLFRLITPYKEINAPITQPKNTLDEIRKAAETLLPGAIIKRHLFFRYSLIWHKQEV